MLNTRACVGAGVRVSKAAAFRAGARAFRRDARDCARALRAMVDGLYENFPDRAAVIWGITQAHRRGWELIRTALQLGAQSVRIGFEDSVYLNADTAVKTNVPLVRQCAEVIRETGKAPASPDQIRQLLGIPLSATN